jgi:hypothetical protein
MKKIGIFLILMIIATTSMVFAEITLSSPESIYNLGDRLYVSADGLRGADSGNLDIDLVCGNKTTNLIRLPARAFSTTEDQVYSIPYKILNEEDLGIGNLTEIIGSCQIISSLGTQISSTDIFKITNEVMVTASLDKTNYKPGEGILVEINAIKLNGDLLNGFLESSNITVFTKAVVDGYASETFSLPETTEAGSYRLDIQVYDTGKNGVLNEGRTFVEFNIDQIISFIATSLSDVEVNPGSNFTIGVEVFDQSGQVVEGTSSVKIISPNNEIIELAIPAQDFITTDFPSNSTAGVWKVVSNFGDISEEREFEMKEFQKAEFDLDGEILSIKNVGNVKYNRTISVQIGEDELELKLKINVGEVRKFNLGAPEGEYEVLINDGESSITKNVLLTGNAVSIESLESVGIFKNYSIVWIFLIIVLGATGTLLFLRYRKTKTLKDSSKFAKKPNGIKAGVSAVGAKVRSKMPSKFKSGISDSLNYTNKSPKVQGLDHNSYSHEDKTMIDLTNKKLSGAESTLVLKGEKQQSSVIAVNIKNYDSLKDNAKSELVKIIGGSKSSKGLVDWRGDHIFIVFSPIITRTYSNEGLASKEGLKILKRLEEHNKKFKDKIEFNLGIHTGELVASKAGEKLKYTSIGNTISLAKRISDTDNGKLLVSDAIRKKLLRELKVTKGKEVGNNQTYEVSEIVDRAANAAKLKDLLKRTS